MLSSNYMIGAEADLVFFQNDLDPEERVGGTLAVTIDGTGQFL